ncbi:FixH family protein [uncultured Sunxiuqinia sp.]|uniref:FixH family protein n=1 Tax=Sunxiuqinia rutila TaxID=1397841 RepID=UPI002625D7D8|nr:FixH family protein [uncultured Sunxiuqinia sp.]
MKLKINWGTGIAIALLIMMSGMVYLVSIAVRQDYYLVEDDYYQKSVNYQAQIDKIQNVNKLTERVKLVQSAHAVQINFPQLFKHELLEGTIHFYSPMSENNDLSLPLKLDEQLSQSVSIKKLPKGRYIVKLDWTANEKPYFQELEIQVP